MPPPYHVDLMSDKATPGKAGLFLIWDGRKDMAGLLLAVERKQDSSWGPDYAIAHTLGVCLTFWDISSHLGG